MHTGNAHFHSFPLGDDCSGIVANLPAPVQSALRQPGQGARRALPDMSQKRRHNRRLTTCAARTGCAPLDSLDVWTARRCRRKRKRAEEKTARKLKKMFSQIRARRRHRPVGSLSAIFRAAASVAAAWTAPRAGASPLCRGRERILLVAGATALGYGATGKALLRAAPLPGFPSLTTH